MSTKKSSFKIVKDLPILDMIAICLVIISIITSIIVASGVHSIHWHFKNGLYPLDKYCDKKLSSFEQRLKSAQLIGWIVDGQNFIVAPPHFSCFSWPTKFSNVQLENQVYKVPEYFWNDGILLTGSKDISKNMISERLELSTSRFGVDCATITP